MSTRLCSGTRSLPPSLGWREREEVRENGNDKVTFFLVIDWVSCLVCRGLSVVKGPRVDFFYRRRPGPFLDITDVGRTPKDTSSLIKTLSQMWYMEGEGEGEWGRKNLVLGKGHVGESWVTFTRTSRPGLVSSTGTKISLERKEGQMVQGSTYLPLRPVAMDPTRRVQVALHYIKRNSEFREWIKIVFDFSTDSLFHHTLNRPWWRTLWWFFRRSTGPVHNKRKDVISY